MDNKKLGKLAEISYIDNRLDEDRVNRIIKQLNRSEFREYLKALKREEKKHYVYIDYAYELSDENKKRFEELFPTKLVVFQEDPQLLFGIRITENDMVYNMNMKSALEQIKIYLDR